MAHCCEEMFMMVEEEKSIVYLPQYREYGVPILDGGSSILVMNFCPWCGRKLPASLREEFYAILEAANIDYCGMSDNDDRLPEAMRSSRWWEEDPKYNSDIPPANDRAQQAPPDSR